MTAALLELLDRLVFAVKTWLDIQKLDFLPVASIDA